LKARHVDVTIVHETLSSLWGIVMSSIGTTLLNSLRSIERPGDFCVVGQKASGFRCRVPPPVANEIA
jgi:hypothetical protein